MESLPSLTISMGRRGRYVMSGGATAAMEDDSTITAGCGKPPFSLAGTYGTNNGVLGFASSRVAPAVLRFGRSGSFSKLAQASSTVSAFPQMTPFSLAFQL